jgi:MmyB-like transcription regulator ligand binding domain
LAAGWPRTRSNSIRPDLGTSGPPLRARATATGQRFPRFRRGQPGGPTTRFHPVSSEGRPGDPGPARGRDSRHVSPVRPANSDRFVFLDPGAHDFYVDWERAANDVVGVPRSEAGRNPYDRALSDLVGELSTQSDEFRARWAAHNVSFRITGIKRFHHPVVGDLSLTYDRMDLPADTGLTLFTYTAEPGSESEEALNLLGSWAATLDQAEPAQATDGP